MRKSRRQKAEGKKTEDRSQELEFRALGKLTVEGDQ